MGEGEGRGAKPTREACWPEAHRSSGSRLLQKRSWIE